ncbi:hypothetical protein BHZ80_22985, partial [Salmonella enterica]|nr:hypothetical protein [Salmonella enterica]
MRGDIIKIVVCGSVIVSVSLTSVTVCADETKVDIPLMQPTPAPGMPHTVIYSYSSTRLNNAVAAGQAAGALIPDIEDRIAKLTQAYNELGTQLSNPVNSSPNSQAINKAAIDTKALISTEIENLTQLKTAAEVYKAVTTPIPPGSISTGKLSNNTDPSDFQRASERLKLIMTNAIQNADSLINSSTMIKTNASGEINVTKTADTTSTYFNGEINTSVNVTTANTVGAISTEKTTAVITGLGSGTVNATSNGEGQAPSNVIAVGNDTLASVKDGESAIVIGDNAHVENSSIGIGRMAIATEGGLALGDGTNAGDSAIAIGTSSSATGQASVATGLFSKATGANSVALGANSVAKKDNDVSIGGSIWNDVTSSWDDFTRTLSGLSDGTDAHDAVNKGQLDTAKAAANTYTDSEIQKVLDKGSATVTDAFSIGTDAQATGVNSTATGVNSRATGDESTAIGIKARASGKQSVVTGARASAEGMYSTAIGAISEATGANSVALGAYSVADQDNQVSIGFKLTDPRTGKVESYTRTLSNLTDGTDAHDAVNKGQLDTAKTAAVNEANTNTATEISKVLNQGSSTSTESFSIGENAQATGDRSTATGVNSQATGNGSIAIGMQARASGKGSVVTGAGAYAEGIGSIATGGLSQATGEASTAIGLEAKTTGNNSVALGASSVADLDNQVSIGQKITDAATGAVSYITRTLSNLTDGTDAHDAVNKGQLDTAKTAAVTEAKGYTDTAKTAAVN